MAKFVTFEKTDNFVDYSTGEVTSQRETKVLKLEKNTERFFKLFVESVGTLYGLNAASSFKVLFAILNMATTRENVICLAFGMRSRICQTIGIHLNVFTRGLKELVDKEIILKKDDSKDYFTLNPYIFGQGTFIDIEKLRQSIEFEYDFKEGTITRRIGADSITSTGMHILENPNQYEISNIKQEKNENTSNISVSARRRENNNKGITPYPVEPSLLPVSDNNAIGEAKIEESNNTDDARAKKYNDIDKLKYETMIKSFEITSKMLDRIKDLHTDGKKEEAMALQKNMEQYLNNFSSN